MREAGSEAGPAIGLLVCDVDGTLVRHDKSLADATVAAVKRLRDAGVPTTLISARPPSGMLPIAAKLGLDGPIAAFNGGTLFVPGKAATETHVVPPEVAAAILAMGTGAGVTAWLFTGGHWYATDAANPHVAREKLSSAQEPVLVQELTPWLHDVDKLVLVSDDAALLHDLAERAAPYATQATVVQSQTYFLDVTALAANKGDAVAALARAYGVPLDRVAAVGDMPNDVPMLTRAGLGIAMGQAPDAVKAAARSVTTSNEEDGVAHAIDTLLMPALEQHA